MAEAHTQNPEPGPHNAHLQPGDYDLRRISLSTRVGWSIYQQVAALVAALGLAAIIRHLWDIGWQGMIETLLNVWDETIRPVMAWALPQMSDLILKLVGLNLELPPFPQWISDYLTVGVILALSMFRTWTVARRLRAVIRRSEQTETQAYELNPIEAILLLVLGSFLFIVCWPLVIAYLVLISERYMRDANKVLAVVKDLYKLPSIDPSTLSGQKVFRRLRTGYRIAILQVLSPLIYLGLLVIANALIIPHFS